MAKPGGSLTCFSTATFMSATTGYINHRFTGRTVDTAANYVGEWPIDNDSWDWSSDPAPKAQSTRTVDTKAQDGSVTSK